MRSIKGLTGLRFIAAFYVFVFHIDMSFRTPLDYLPVWLKAIIEQGRIGVTLFFVLSGFVLAYSYLKDFQKPEIKNLPYIGKFMFKRLARIYPVYLSGLMLSIFISSFFNSLPGSKIIFYNIMFFQTYFPDIIWIWYGGGAWSVSNEIFFYILFPFAFPVLLMMKQKKHLMILIGILAIFGTTVDLISNGSIPSPLPFPFPYTWAYWFPVFRFPEFLIGMIAGILVFHFDWKTPNWVPILLLMISAVYLSMFGSRLPGTLTHNWIIIPTIVSLLSVLAQPRVNFFFKWFESKPMQYLGQVSYAFYIFQIPLMIALDHLIRLERIGHTNSFVLPVTFILNLIGGILLHEIIEKKAHAFLMRLSNRRIHRTLDNNSSNRVYSKV